MKRQEPTEQPTSARDASKPEDQRDELLQSEREANKSQARNFKEDALADKVVSVEPDGTGPTSTKTFDPKVDQALGSGNDDAETADREGQGAAKARPAGSSKA